MNKLCSTLIKNSFSMARHLSCWARPPACAGVVVGEMPAPLQWPCQPCLTEESCEIVSDADSRKSQVRNSQLVNGQCVVESRRGEIGLRLCCGRPKFDLTVTARGWLVAKGWPETVASSWPAAFRFCATSEGDSATDSTSQRHWPWSTFAQGWSALASGLNAMSVQRGDTARYDPAL